MAKTLISTDGLAAGCITRSQLNTTLAASAVIAKVIAGAGVALTSTGVDSGTGDVTAAIDQTFSPTWTGNHTFSPTSGTGVTINGTAGANAVINSSAAANRSSWTFNQGATLAARIGADGTQNMFSDSSNGDACFGSAAGNVIFGQLANYSWLKLTAIGATFATSVNIGNYIASGTVADGLITSNTSGASAGAQRYSPSVHWQGQGWATTPARSQPADWISYVLPIQGAAAITSQWVLASSINGGAYNTAVTITTGGTTPATSFTGSLAGTNMRVTGATIPVNGIYMPSTNVLGFASNSTLRGTFDATGALNLTGPTTATTLNISGSSGTPSSLVVNGYGPSTVVAQINAGSASNSVAPLQIVNGASAAGGAALRIDNSAITATHSTASGKYLPVNCDGTVYFLPLYT